MVVVGGVVVLVVVVLVVVVLIVVVLVVIVVVVVLVVIVVVVLIVVLLIVVVFVFVVVVCRLVPRVLSNMLVRKTSIQGNRRKLARDDQRFAYRLGVVCHRDARWLRLS